MSEILKHQMTFKKGEILFQAGSKEDLFYFVISGFVGIYANSTQGQTPLAVVGRLQAVGDLAVIDGSARLATAVALSDVTAIPIQRSKVEEQLALYPPWFCTVVKLLVARLRTANEVISRNSIRDSKLTSMFEAAAQATGPATKSKKMTAHLKNLDKDLSASGPKPEPQLALTFKKGEVLFREGESGDFFYFVEKGDVGIFRDYDNERVPLAKLHGRQVLGEMSAIDGQCRSATAVALSEVALTKISRTKFDEQLIHSRLWFRALIQTIVERLRHANEIISRSKVHDGELMSVMQEVFSSSAFSETKQVVSGGKVPALDQTKTVVKGSGDSEEEAVTAIAGDGKDLLDTQETLVKGKQDHPTDEKTAAKIESAATTGEPKLIRIGNRQKTVLVCDSDPQFLAAISKQLAGIKVQVIGCGTMGQAQIKLANQKFGCLLVNLKLKTGDATKLIRRIRSLEADEDEHLPIFVITQSEDAHLLKSVQGMIDEVIELPQDPAAIVHRLTGLF